MQTSWLCTFTASNVPLKFQLYKKLMCHRYWKYSDIVCLWCEYMYQTFSEQIDTCYWHVPQLAVADIWIADWTVWGNMNILWSIIWFLILIFFVWWAGSAIIYTAIVYVWGLWTWLHIEVHGIIVLSVLTATCMSRIINSLTSLCCPLELPGVSLLSST